MGSLLLFVHLIPVIPTLGKYLILPYESVHNLQAATWFIIMQVAIYISYEKKFNTLYGFTYVNAVYIQTQFLVVLGHNF